ncbi:GRIP1-associated protein, putative [Perkinsus marinus ATCC 50983]|uniref:GRIP1-associated protein, putative n=1 Tax=Perkinsus marinus (strain ATCC 50983 / TXsc) TaxID=423536 RepID=C5KI54_PERM5|nr:GRIP1-associated protein, putative [Perkinsus marinus ATCC 50983]EER16266.1 GRIP1-associated protein, putative [Perkinsus marinus ATCC 50983]|eukprot:XP_002784470.1 GRIP1-associated protein, putative [Perkinsus marinus ATCC 50983]
MQWGGRDSSRSLAVRNAEFATSLRQHVPGRKQTKHRCPSRDRQRTPVARRSVSPQKGMGAITNPFTGTPGRPQDYINRREMQIEKLHSSSLQQELDESMSELAIVQRRCHSLEESLTIAEAQHVKARNMNARLKERLQLFQEQNAENCRIAEMEISKLTARLTSAETTIGRLQDENNALDEAVRAQANELKFLKDVEARLEAERDEAFRGGQKLEESLRELAQDFETVSDQLEREKREAQTAKLQLEELMEASLGQAEKLEAAQRLARASRCVAHSVRRGSQARLCAVVLRSWRKDVLGRARSAEKCRLALRVLRLRGRQGRLKRHGTAAVMMQRRKVLRSTMLKWTTAASRARYIRQVCEHLMSRRSLRLLRQTLLGWVLHLLGCSVTIKERNNEDRLQQALQKTASLRSLLHSQEERIAALETGEEASVTRIKRLKSKLDARDDEIDRLRRDVQLLEEINHKLRLTSVLEPLTDTVITSPIASDVTSRSLAPSEYSSNGLPSDVGSRAVPLLQLESIE